MGGSKTEAEHTDEQVLADPGSYTVEQVTEVFARSSAEDVEDAKTTEAEGHARKGIADWQPAASAEPEPTFSRERLFADDRITGQPRHVIAGALEGDETTEFTRGEIARKIKNFLERPVEPVEQED